MPGPLSGRLLGIDGRPTRSARIALALVALTAFALAFVVTAGSATQATHPAPALTDEAPAVQEPVSATLRRAAPLPALRRERRRERRRAPAQSTATLAPAQPAAPAPVVSTPAPAPPAPAVTAEPQQAPEPTTAPTADPEPSPTFDSTGDFDSSG